MNEFEGRSSSITSNDEPDDGQSFPIIVIGASAGGFDALRKLASLLPKDLNAALLIVWHMSPTITGVLPQVLNRFDRVYAAEGYDNEPIQPNRIYIAPPDKHMIVENGKIRITRGPKENRFRPAIDPLFRSAAYIYGPRVVGIILSGALDDGTAGLWAVKSFGGTAIVQDPEEAEVKSMPLSALREVYVDHCAPLIEIADLIVTITEGQTNAAPKFQQQHNDLIEAEIKIAEEESTTEKKIMEFGELSPYTCPDCSGVLMALKDGNIERYRCHTGHAFSADSLLDALTEKIEQTLYSAIRGVDESVMLLNHMGDHFAERNETKLAALFFNKAKEAMDRSDQMRKSVLSHEHLTQQKILDDGDRKKYM